MFSPLPPTLGKPRAALSRRDLICAAMLLLFLGLSLRCAPVDSPAPEPRGLNASLDRARDFLLARQSKDGAWRSDTYGAMKDGMTLTPHVLDALSRLPQAGRNADANRLAVAFLIDQLNPDGSLRSPALPYLVYSVAGACDVVARHSPGDRAVAARVKFLAILRRHQFTEDLGWSPSDLLYGGWGYSNVEPRKPATDDPRGATLEANLSATVYALEAFRAAGVSADDPALLKARVFLSRVQNFGRDEPAFDDGGFYFTPVDAMRNKAGFARTSDTRPRFTSYGTMTADGLRALVLLNDRGDARSAALQWLETRFRADEQPGGFSREQHLFKHGMYYYYCASAALTLAGEGRTTLRTGRGDIAWADALARQLIARQQTDGAWVNAYTDSKEDDPLVATAQGIIALSACRDTLLRQARFHP